MAMRNILVTLIVMLMMSGPAWAKSACYTPAEAEAEQGIRIHSELMVIGLNCQNMRIKTGDNLYNRYRRFTKDNANIFADYEARLMSHFKSQGQNPVATLDKMRTKFANKISQDAIKMKPDQFCNRYAGRIFKAAEMDPPTIRKWAATIYPSHPVSKPICEH